MVAEWKADRRTMRTLAFVICAAPSGCDEKNIAGPSVPINQQFALDPYPFVSRPIQPGDYRATLRVTQ